VTIIVHNYAFIAFIQSGFLWYRILVYLSLFCESNKIGHVWRWERKLMTACRLCCLLTWFTCNLC